MAGVYCNNIYVNTFSFVQQVMSVRRSKCNRAHGEPDCTCHTHACTAGVIPYKDYVPFFASFLTFHAVSLHQLNDVNSAFSSRLKVKWRKPSWHRPYAGLSASLWASVVFCLFLFILLLFNSSDCSPQHQMREWSLLFSSCLLLVYSLTTRMGGKRYSEMYSKILSVYRASHRTIYVYPAVRILHLTQAD